MSKNKIIGMIIAGVGVVIISVFLFTLHWILGCIGLGIGLIIAGIWISSDDNPPTANRVSEDDESL